MARIVFMGTPHFAVPSLDALVAAGHDVVAVYTQPARRAGRGKALLASAVQKRAEALGIEVRSPVSLRDAEAQAAFAALGADLAVVAAYGLILPRVILDAPLRGCINVHASLLPRWRGAAPIQRAILAGDWETGVTIMQMEVGLDTGPMLAKFSMLINQHSVGSLSARLSQEGAKLLVRVLEEPKAFPPIAQPNDGVTYAPKVDKSEARLNFSMPAEQVVRQVHAFSPSPGAWFEFRGERIRILSGHALMLGGGRPGEIIDQGMIIACSPGAVKPTSVQRAGRATMQADELLRGFPMPIGTQLA